ncbi:MAG TPA: twin-arginine translocase subunit TatC [Nocardioidaceae bacterium]|jgi:sec-independent protein translocase protein TatC|nr:twin-arginine translocase subunit TatC [Nocardioidaceae bacterium]
MSVTGVIGLFRANPRHRVGAGGQMALSDHLRELRARLLRVVLVLLIAVIVALFFYNQLLELVIQPYNQAVKTLHPGTKTLATINGVGGPLMLQLKLSGVAAVVATSPYWLHQIWGFIVPGLHPHEKRWTRLFASVAGPLFVAGVAVGYYVLPKGLSVLIGFTPESLTNLVDFGEYFSFMTRMLLVFGVAFEIPIFVVLLNLAGVVSGRTLGNHRPWIVIGTFVFAAVATPSTDPFSMLMLALPMVVLFMISEVIARIVDKRRGVTAYDGLEDDEASDLDHRADPIGRSDLSEDED